MIQKDPKSIGHANRKHKHVSDINDQDPPTSPISGDGASSAYESEFRVVGLAVKLLDSKSRDAGSSPAGPVVVCCIVVIFILDCHEGSTEACFSFLGAAMRAHDQNDNEVIERSTRPCGGLNWQRAHAPLSVLLWDVGCGPRWGWNKKFVKSKEWFPTIPVQVRSVPCTRG